MRRLMVIALFLVILAACGGDVTNATVKDSTKLYTNAALATEIGVLMGGDRVLVIGRTTDNCSIKTNGTKGWLGCQNLSFDEHIDPYVLEPIPTATLWLGPTSKWPSRHTPLAPGGGSSGGSRSSEPTLSQVTSAKREMSEWAEGRWLSHSAYWDSSSQRFILRAVAHGDANSVAVEGYCRIMKDIAREYLRGFNVSASISRDGKSKVCR